MEELWVWGSHIWWIMLILLHVNHFHPHAKFYLSIIGRQQKVTPRRCSYHHLSILQALPARAWGLRDIEETRARTDDAHLCKWCVLDNVRSRWLPRVSGPCFLCVNVLVLNHEYQSRQQRHLARAANQFKTLFDLDVRIVKFVFGAVILNGVVKCERMNIITVVQPACHMFLGGVSMLVPS